jgi:hypothetical protein
MRGQLGKVARLPPTLPQRFTPEPSDHPHDIHGRCREELLEVRAPQPDVATPAQIKAPRAWREATLDARSQGILGFELGGLLPLAGGLDGLMVELGADRELAWSAFRRGARRTGGTRATGGPVKPDADDRIARDLAARSPIDAGLALGTVRVLGLPMQHKGLHIITLSGLMWPTIGPKGRAYDIDVMLALGGDQAVGIPIAAVE